MYDKLISCLERKRISAFFQNPSQLVVSAGIPNFPTVNSFWVTQVREQWYLSTWLPAVYRIPKEQNICELCAEVPQSSQTAIYRVEEHHVAKYGLERLSEEEADSLFANLL